MESRNRLKRVMLVFPPNVDVVEPFRSAKRKPPSLSWGFPMGLGYLAAVLQRRGFMVSILDACLDTIPIGSIMKEIKNFQPDLVGIGTMTPLLRTSIELAEKIKQHDKDMKVVLGGPHATYDYEGLLKFNFIDYIVLGEGEGTFLELCERLKRNEPVDEMKGVAFRNNSPSFRPLIEDLDNLPLPARELTDFERYIKSYGILEKSIDIVSSRGCTNRCAFCSSGHFFGRWRSRSPENIVMEIKTLVEKYAGVGSINFMDDVFTVDKERVIKLCNLLIDSGLNRYSWVCLARVNQLDEEMVWAMKAAGCIRIHLGIESGSPYILKNISKHISLEEARAAVKLLSMARIEPYSFFMIGNPGETTETIELTKRFARGLKSANTNFFIAQTFPGTRLEKLQPVENWSEYLYEPEVKNPSIFTHPCVPNFIPEGFTRETLKKICSNITRRFIFLHFFRRYRLSIRKFIIEPKSTIGYLFKVFFNK